MNIYLRIFFTLLLYGVPVLCCMVGSPGLASSILSVISIIAVVLLWLDVLTNRRFRKG